MVLFRPGHAPRVEFRDFTNLSGCVKFREKQQYFEFRKRAGGNKFRVTRLSSKAARGREILESLSMNPLKPDVVPETWYYPEIPHST